MCTGSIYRGNHYRWDRLDPNDSVPPSAPMGEHTQAKRRCSTRRNEEATATKRVANTHFLLISNARNKTSAFSPIGMILYSHWLTLLRLDHKESRVFYIRYVRHDFFAFKSPNPVCTGTLYCIHTTCNNNNNNTSIFFCNQARRKEVR